MTERRYLVQLRSDGRRRALSADSFEGAALAYLEACHPPADGEGEVSLIVREEVSGLQQCFRIDVATGRAEPC